MDGKMKLKILLLALLLPLQAFGATNLFDNILVNQNALIRGRATVGTNEVFSGVQLFVNSTATTTTNLLLAPIAGQTAPVFITRDTAAAMAFKIDTTGGVTFTGNDFLDNGGVSWTGITPILVQNNSGSVRINGTTDILFGTTGGAMRGIWTSTSLTSSNLFIPVAGIRGVTNGSDATAGNIGEYFSANRAQASGFSLANITHTTVVTLTLPAGDWDISGLAQFNPAATTTFRNLLGGFTTTTNGNPAVSQFAYADQGYPVGYTLGGYATSIFVPNYRFVCTTTSNLYLNVFAEFATSTMTGYGFMTARRSANAK